MSRAALRRVQAFADAVTDLRGVLVYYGPRGAGTSLTVADLRAVVVMAERSAGLEEAMGGEIATSATKRKAAKR